MTDKTVSDDFTLRLHAYADGELDTAEAQAVEAHLQACAACRVDFDGIRQLKAAMKQVDWTEDVPPGLAGGIRRRVEAARARRTATMTGAGGLLAACLAGALLLFRPVSPVDDVVGNHVRMLTGRVSDTVAASDGVKPWLQARLDFAPPVLTRAGGCTLISAHTDRVARRKASALTYSCAGRTVDFYAIAGNGRDERSPLVAPHVLRSQGYRVVGWQRGKLTCFAVSDAPVADLLTLARYIESHAAEG